MAEPSLLTPLQRDFLESFFAPPWSKDFFLTGGTALAEFYLNHRRSEDLDLFTVKAEALELAGSQVDEISKGIGGSLSPGVKSLDFRPIYLTRSSEPVLKIDLVREVGPQFGVHQKFGKVIVDSELNIAVNKVTALFSRAAGKDFVDLYFLLHKEYEISNLMTLAKEKDGGFTEFYFAGMLREVRNLSALPEMIKPLRLADMKSFFEVLAEQIIIKLKPSK
jgi:hypothetical protein